jgi:hypothetical protein
LIAAVVSLSVPASRSFAQTLPFALPRELTQPFAFSWSGPLEGAIQTLAMRIGYGSWAGTATALAMPVPTPRVEVSVNFSAASAPEIVEALNNQALNRAVVVLDPDQRTIGVVYYV